MAVQFLSLSETCRSACVYSELLPISSHRRTHGCQTSLPMRRRLWANPNRCFPVLYAVYGEDARPFPVTFPHVHVFSCFAAAIPPIMSMYSPVSLLLSRQ